MQETGYCECGCGERTRLAYRTDTERGWRRGQPMRFIIGHAARLQRKPFESQFAAGSSDDCWTWNGTADKDGYGLVQENGRLQRAHRVAYERQHGQIAGGLHVLHRCDNPPCVNPAHLFLGTNADNMRDKATKGRGSNGRESGQLDHQRAAEIRTRYSAGGITYRALAADYGVSESMVGMVVRGKAWA